MGAPDAGCSDVERGTIPLELIGGLEVGKDDLSEGSGLAVGETSGDGTVLADRKCCLRLPELDPS